MMDKSVRDVIAGGTWLFVSNLVVSVSGLLFWLLMTGLSGVEAVGVGGGVISATMIAVMVSSSGLNLAVSKEIAAYSYEAVDAGLIVGLVLGLVSGGIGGFLVAMLGYGDKLIVYYVALLAFSTTLSQVVLYTFVGLEFFKNFFKSNFIGSLMKVIVGVIFVLLGYRIIAIFMGLLAFPLFIVLSGLVLIYARRGDKRFKVSLRIAKEIVTLTFSNYPLMLSSQILTVLSVYLFALFSGEKVLTGVLYISMMIMLGVAGIPVAMLNASLPIATRRNSDPFSDTLRLGVTLVTPLTVGIIVAPDLILGIIDKTMVSEALTLSILMLSVIPFTATMAVTMKFNRESKKKELTLLGLVRLAILLVTIFPLVERFGVIGVSISYLLANISPLPLVFKHIQESKKLILNIMISHLSIFLLFEFIKIPKTSSLFIAPLFVVLVLYLTRTINISDFIISIRIIVRTLFRSR